MNRVLCFFVQLSDAVEYKKSVLVFIDTYIKLGGIMKNMVIDDRLLFCESLFISLSATQFLL